MEARQPRHVGGRDVGHVGPDRRACRARSSGMSGPIVGHVGPDRRACRARLRSGRRLSEIALLGFHSAMLGRNGGRGGGLWGPTLISCLWCVISQTTYLTGDLEVCESSESSLINHTS